MLIGLAGLAGAVALFFLVATLGDTRREVRFGSDEFSPGRAEDVAERIERDRRPDCFNDPNTGDRPVCVIHTGDDPQTGWTAVVAQVDGCAVQWKAAAQEFVDSCTDERYPADGSGLDTLPVRVEDGRLVVDVAPR